MLLFGPISSLFDFATFALMIYVFRAMPGEFRAGWFVESIATQTLIIFAIRTRRIPFLRSKPSPGLLWAALGVVSIGIYLPLSPLAGLLGLNPLPAGFFLTLLGLAVVYLILVEVAKSWFFSRSVPAPDVTARVGADHHINRRAARFSSRKPLPSPSKRAPSPQALTQTRRRR
jgi:P-type Mg2+ transporter